MFLLPMLEKRKKHINLTLKLFPSERAIWLVHLLYICHVHANECQSVQAIKANFISSVQNDSLSKSGEAAGMSGFGCSAQFMCFMGPDLSREFIQEHKTSIGPPPKGSLQLVDLFRFICLVICWLVGLLNTEKIKLFKK